MQTQSMQQVTTDRAIYRNNEDVFTTRGTTVDSFYRDFPAKHAGLSIFAHHPYHTHTPFSRPHPSSGPQPTTRLAHARVRAKGLQFLRGGRLGRWQDVCGRLRYGIIINLTAKSDGRIAFSPEYIFPNLCGAFLTHQTQEHVAKVEYCAIFSVGVCASRMRETNTCYLLTHPIFSPPPLHL